VNPAAYLEMAETEAKHWWFSGRRSILYKTLESMNLPPDSKILEVGCGTGGNLQMLAKFGDVSAFEMDTTARGIALEKTNNLLDIQAGFCPDNIPFKDQQFDLICMFDVLEHIEKDVETLSSLMKKLKKNGRILITVPAYQWLYGPHDKFLHHKRRYYAKDLQEKCISAELQPLRVSYFNTILFPLAFAVRLKDKLFGNQEATGTSIPPVLINKLFTVIFSAERFFLKYLNLPFGVSLLCILTAHNKN